MEPAAPPFSLILTLSVVAGLLVAAAAAGAVVSFRRRGRLCPSCGSTTLPLVPILPLRVLGRWIHRRWCPGCDWKGTALRPAHERRSADGAVPLPGFKWGKERPLPPGRPPIFLFAPPDGRPPRLPFRARLPFRWRR